MHKNGVLIAQSHFAVFFFTHSYEWHGESVKYTRGVIRGIQHFKLKCMYMCTVFRNYLSEVAFHQLKHVKAWLISSADHWKDKTVFGLKQRCFYPRGNQKLTTNKT